MSIYLALGDSISIDDYTGVRGGGAPSQFARKLGAVLVDLTRDGNTTRGGARRPRWRTSSRGNCALTAGGNDLLGGEHPRAILRRLHQIAKRIQSHGGPVVLNTIYDPSDGDNELGRRELGLSWLAAIGLRRRLNAVNGGIGELAREHGFLLADLERLFHGHGVASNEPWFIHVIGAEPRRCDRRRGTLVRAADVAPRGLIEQVAFDADRTQSRFLASPRPSATGMLGTSGPCPTRMKRSARRPARMLNRRRLQDRDSQWT
jgi:hypothetical protein